MDQPLVRRLTAVVAEQLTQRPAAPTVPIPVQIA